VLVGHSFAGKVVAAVADRAPEKVKMILYLDAFRPQKIRKPQGSFDPTEYGPVEGWTIPLTEQILDYIGKDVQDKDRELMLSKGTPWPKKLASDPVTLSENFDSINRAYIFCTGGGDDVEEILKEKLDGPYKVIESGHFPMITKPQELGEDMLILSGGFAP
jgi:pimeloyl-ACP methyl ester carboxylesterase